MMLLTGLAAYLAGILLIGCADSSGRTPAAADTAPVSTEGNRGPADVMGSRQDNSANGVEDEIPPPGELRDRVFAGESTERRAALELLVGASDGAEYFAVLAKLLLDDEAAPLADDALEVLVSMRPVRLLPQFLALVDSDSVAAPKVRSIILAAYEGKVVASATVELLRRKGAPAYAAWAPQLPLLAQSRSPVAVEFLVSQLSAADRGLKNDIKRALESLTGRSFTDDADWLKWWAENSQRPRERWLEDSIVETRRRLSGLAGEWLSTQLQSLRGTEKGEEEIVALMRRLLSGTDRELRRISLTKLAEMETSYAQKLRPDLVALVSQEYAEDVRLLALRVLAGVGDAATAGEIAVHMDDPRPGIRKAVAQTLGKLNYPESVAALMNSLSTDDAATLAAVVESLGRLKARQALPGITALLEKDLSTDALAAVVDAIGEIGERESEAAILSVKASLLAERRLRVSFANALGSIGSPAAAANLEPLLSDEFPDVRQAAVSAVGRLRATELLAKLVDLLENDQEAAVRRAAAVALGAMGSKDAVPALLRAAKESEAVGSDAWQAALQLAAGDPRALLDIAEHCSGSTSVNADVRRRTIGLLQELLGERAEAPLTAEQTNRARTLLAGVLIDGGEDGEAIAVLEKLRGNGGMTEWSESALLAAYGRTRQYKKAVALCDDMIARAKPGSVRYWNLRINKVSLMLDASELEQGNAAIAALLAEPGLPEDLKQKVAQLGQRCLEKMAALRAEREAQRVKIHAALNQMQSTEAGAAKKATAEILGMGRDAVPFLLEIIENKETQYYAVVSQLLEGITGLKRPLTAASTTTELDEAVRVWQDWWKESK
ncbi:MAG: HEAT repeat domain-containing protein [Planctomycetota bacterium]|nr:HEAT repeat domain-containing protein [Planctomycetota bacterium]